MFQQRKRTVIVDPHVHLRTIFSIENFVENLIINFNHTANHFNIIGTLTAVICIVDDKNENGFEKLSTYFQNYIQSDGQGRWKHQKTVEQSIVITFNDGFTLVVVAGSQIVTRENIELLSIGTTFSSMEGEELENLIIKIAEEGALPILPWGVGKWLGSRGRIIRQILTNSKLPTLFVGDSGNRPKFWPKSSLFRIAEQRGIKNLPGSDPLPVRNGEKNIGLSGFRLDARLDMKRPYSSLKTALLDPETVISPYVKNIDIINFFKQQFLHRLKKN